MFSSVCLLVPLRTFAFSESWVRWRKVVRQLSQLGQLDAIQRSSSEALAHVVRSLWLILGQLSLEMMDGSSCCREDAPQMEVQEVMEVINAGNRII